MNNAEYDSLSMTEQAGYWLDSLNGRVDPSEERPSETFSEWTDRSIDHQKAFVSLMTSEELLKSLIPDDRSNIEALLASARLEDQRVAARWAMLIHVGRVAAPIAVMVFAVLAYWLLSMYRGWLEYPVLIGGARTYILEDATRLRVGPRSWVRVRQTPELRFATLLHGQAEFAVAKDERRPFDVETGMWTYRALGTKFEVRKERDTSRVKVLEGIVLARLEGSTSPPTPIGEGYAMDMANSGTVSVIERPVATPVSSLAATTSARVELERVQGTVGEISEHFSSRPQGPEIEVTPAAYSQPFSASMPPDDVDLFIKFLRIQSNLTVTAVNGRYVVDVKGSR